MKFVQLIAFLLLANMAFSINLRNGNAISGELNEEKMTETFSFTIPVRKNIDESRFTESFSYSIPINTESKVMDAKKENKAKKENLKTIDNQKYSSQNGDGIYHTQIQEQIETAVVEEPALAQGPGYGVYTKPGVPILNSAFPRPQGAKLDQVHQDEHVNTLDTTMAQGPGYGVYTKPGVPILNSAFPRPHGAKQDSEETDEHTNDIETSQGVGKPTPPIGAGVPILNSAYPRAKNDDEENEAKNKKKSDDEENEAKNKKKSDDEEGLVASFANSQVKQLEETELAPFDASDYSELTFAPVALTKSISSYAQEELKNRDPDNKDALLIGKKSYEGELDEAGRIFNETPNVIQTEVPVTPTAVSTVKSKVTESKKVLWQGFPKYEYMQNYKDVHYNQIPVGTVQETDNEGNLVLYEKPIQNYPTPITIGHNILGHSEIPIDVHTIDGTANPIKSREFTSTTDREIVPNPTF